MPQPLEWAIEIDKTTPSSSTEKKKKKLLDKGNNRKDHKMQIIQLESMKLMYE